MPKAGEVSQKARGCGQRNEQRHGVLNPVLITWAPVVVPEVLGAVHVDGDNLDLTFKLFD
jgi:hypothetical protein